MNQEKIAARLVDAGVPPTRVVAKANDSMAGWVLTAIGAGAFLAATVLAWLLISKGVEVGMWVVLLITLFVGLAFFFVGIGLHLLARDAAPTALQAVANVIVGIINAFRGKKSE